MKTQQPTDTQLKQALAKMLPGGLLRWSVPHKCYVWIESNAVVEDTELLHLCWLMEEELSDSQIYGDNGYIDQMLCMPKSFGEYGRIHATWQQRVIALARVKAQF